MTIEHHIDELRDIHRSINAEWEPVSDIWRDSSSQRFATHSLTPFLEHLDRFAERLSLLNAQLDATYRVVRK